MDELNPSEIEYVNHLLHHEVVVTISASSILAAKGCDQNTYARESIQAETPDAASRMAHAVACNLQPLAAEVQDAS